MRRAYLLAVTAMGEGGTGLLLLAVPGVPLALLFGVEHAPPVAAFVARFAGGALLAIGVACWLGRGDALGEARLPLIAGALVYDAAAAGLLAYAGLSLGFLGVALWPAVVLHATLAVWCVACCLGEPHGEGRGAPDE
jgi:hypothetical protein